jgi:hypothetical protein
MRTLAKTLIGVLGATATLRKPDGSGGYEDLGEVKVTPFEASKGPGIFRAGGSGLPLGAYKVGIAPSALEEAGIALPQMGWDLVKDGVAYWILEITPTYSGDQQAYLEMQVVNISEILARAGHEITTQTPDRRKTTTGAKVTDAFTDVKTISPAWVMPLSARAAEEFNRRGMTVTHQIFVSEDPEIGLTGRILFQDRPMRVVDIVNELYADRLWIINAER